MGLLVVPCSSQIPFQTAARWSKIKYKDPASAIRTKTNAVVPPIKSREKSRPALKKFGVE